MTLHRRFFHINQMTIRSQEKFSILVIVDSVEGIDYCIRFFKGYRVKEKPGSPVHLTLLVDPQLTIQQVRDFLTEMEQWSIDAVRFDLSCCQQYLDSADLVLYFNTSYVFIGDTHRPQQSSPLVHLN